MACDNSLRSKKFWGKSLEILWKGCIYNTSHYCVLLSALFQWQSSKVFSKVSRSQSFLLCCTSSKHIFKTKFLTCLNTQSTGTMFLHLFQFRQTVKYSTKKYKLPIFIGKRDSVVKTWDGPQGWCVFDFCCGFGLPVLQQSFCTSVWYCEIPVCSK